MGVALLIGVAGVTGQAAGVIVTACCNDSFSFPVEHPPAQVQGLQAQPVPDFARAGRFSVALAETVQLTWAENDPEEGVSEYRVYRDAGGNGDFAQVGSTDETSYVDGDVQDGETYVYYVTAVNDVGESPPSDEASAEVPVDCAALEGSDAYEEAVAAGDCPALEEPEETQSSEGAALETEEGVTEPTPEPTPTDTPEPTPTATPFPTRAPSTATPVSTPTATPVPTDTPEPTPTSEATAEPTATEAPTEAVSGTPEA